MSTLKEHSRASEKRIARLNISGHGYGGGVAYSETSGFCAETLSDDNAKAIRECLTHDAVVVLYACNQGVRRNNVRTNMGLLAMKLAHPIKVTPYTIGIENGKIVVDSSFADLPGDWFRELALQLYGQEPEWITITPPSRKRERKDPRLK